MLRAVEGRLGLGGAWSGRGGTALAPEAPHRQDAWSSGTQGADPSRRVAGSRRRPTRHGMIRARPAIEQLVLSIQEVDQRALAKLVFLAISDDDLSIGVDLARESRNAVIGDGACRPRLVDRFIRISLKPSEPHALLGIPLSHFGAPPQILAAAENIPCGNNLAAQFVASTVNAVRVVARQSTSLQSNSGHERAGCGPERIFRGFTV